MASRTLHDCYNAIIREAKARPQAAGLQFASTYAQVGLQLPDAANWAECLDGARVQARYVRANLAGWRGDEAQAVRQSLDSIINKPKGK